ncbi:MAG: hypothetical protein IJX15_03905 [Ruminiclostridium sp.]|nr:hypothetical protein [Ruminiclostridium sp.]
MKNLSKIERSEQVKFSVQLVACLLLKGLAGARGGSPKPCERLAQHKNKVYREAVSLLTDEVHLRRLCLLYRATTGRPYSTLKLFLNPSAKLTP